MKEGYEQFFTLVVELQVRSLFAFISYYSNAFLTQANRLNLLTIVELIGFNEMESFFLSWTCCSDQEATLHTHLL